MFDNARVPVLLRKLTLKIAPDEDDNENAKRRLCECTFRIPLLDYAQAEQIRLPITGHCFGTDRLPLWGVHDVHFTPPEDKYTVELSPGHGAPDYEPPVWTLELATLQRVRVWRVRKDARDLSLEFVTQHQLPEGSAAPADLAVLLTCWESGAVAITLSTIQIPLALTGGADDTPELVGPMPSSDARRRGGRTH